MASEAKRKARGELAKRPVKVHCPEGFGQPTKSHWQYANTPFTVHYSNAGVRNFRYPHPLASELDIHGTPHKHKPNAHRSRQWRKAFGRGAVRMSAKGFVRVPDGVGMTFQQWLDAGCPKFEWIKGPEGHVNVDDQTFVYARKD